MHCTYCGKDVDPTDPKVVVTESGFECPKCAEWWDENDAYCHPCGSKPCECSTR